MTVSNKFVGGLFSICYEKSLVDFIFTSVHRLKQ